MFNFFSESANYLGSWNWLLTSTVIGSSSLAHSPAAVFTVGLLFIVAADFPGASVLVGTVFEVLFFLDVVLT